MALTFDPPIHPGEVLREEFLAPLQLSPGSLARRLAVPRTRIERIIREQAPVTVDTALRLSRALGTSPQFWLTLQAAYDLARLGPELGPVLDAMEPIDPLAA